MLCIRYSKELGLSVKGKTLTHLSDEDEEVAVSTVKF